MQGIPYFDFKTLQQRLDELLQTAEQTGSVTDWEKATNYKQSLSDVYSRYRNSVEDVSEHTKKFSQVKQEIRQLLIQQKRRLKQQARKSPGSPSLP